MLCCKTQSKCLTSRSLLIGNKIFKDFSMDWINDLLWEKVSGILSFTIFRDCRRHSVGKDKGVWDFAWDYLGVVCRYYFRAFGVYG